MIDNLRRIQRRVKVLKASDAGPVHPFKSSLMPSFVILPFIQCHQTRGCALCGGFSNPLLRESGLLCAGDCPKQRPAQFLPRESDCESFIASPLRACRRDRHRMFSDGAPCEKKAARHFAHTFSLAGLTANHITPSSCGSRVRYWMASAICDTARCSAPSRSAMVRATLRMRSCARAVRPCCCMRAQAGAPESAANSQWVRIWRVSSARLA